MQKFLNSIPKSKCARAQGVCTVEGPSCCDLLIGQQLPCTPSQQNWVKTSPCSATLNSGRPTHCLGPLDQVPGRPAVAIPLQPQMPQKQHLTWHREKGKGHELRQNNPEGGPEQTPPPRSSVSGESTVRHTRCRLICSRSKPRLGSPERRPYLTWAAAGLQEPRSRVSTGDTAPCCPGVVGSERKPLRCSQVCSPPWAHQNQVTGKYCLHVTTRTRGLQLQAHTQHQCQESVHQAPYLHPSPPHPSTRLFLCGKLICRCL